MQSRIHELNTMIAEDPADPFLKYALALELEKSGQKAEAVILLNQVLTQSPDYLPVYYQAARLDILEGRMGEAATTLRKGIEVAKTQKNQHTLSELNFLLSEITEADE